MSEPLVEICNLVKTYSTPAGNLPVLRGINCTIHQGDFIALVGPSGSGKTTFLNMLTGIDTPTDGDVVVDGRTITQVKPQRLTKWRARNIGIVFQLCQLLPTLSVVNNVMAPMFLAKVWKRSERRTRALDLLARFEIGDQANKLPDMLSGGQQQRVALARALANNPKLIICDEPTANLDYMSASRVFELFHQLVDQGHTILIVTHDRELVRDVPILWQIRDGIVEHTSFENLAKRRTEEWQAVRPVSTAVAAG